MALRREQPAQSISYAQAADSRGGRAVIRLMENSTGRLKLIKRAQGFEHELAKGENFFAVMAKRYGLSLEVIEGRLDAIPRDIPLIVIANHPYGILDGLMLGHILCHARSDFRILANSVFKNAPDLSRFVLPINFENTRAALDQNVQTRRSALDYLQSGGAIGVFPGGTVSTAIRPFADPMDPGWRNFTARLVAKSQAVVLPIYFHGHSSRTFQIASHVHVNLRLGLLINEFRKRVDKPVRVSIGQPISQQHLNRFGKDSKAMMDFLRKATYELAPTTQRRFTLGYEFEERHRR